MEVVRLWSGSGDRAEGGWVAVAYFGSRRTRWTLLRLEMCLGDESGRIGFGTATGGPMFKRNIGVGIGIGIESRRRKSRLDRNGMGISEVEAEDRNKEPETDRKPVGEGENISN